MILSLFFRPEVIDGDIRDQKLELLQFSARNQPGNAATEDMVANQSKSSE